MKPTTIGGTGLFVCLSLCPSGLAASWPPVRFPDTGGEASAEDAKGSRSLLSPATGVIIRLDASPEQKVEEGQLLAVIKIAGDEVAVRAHRRGEITLVHVRTGDRVGAGQVLLEIKGAEEEAPAAAKPPSGKRSEEETRKLAEATERELTASRGNLHDSPLFSDSRFREASLRIPPGSDTEVSPSTDDDALDAYGNGLDLYEEMFDESKQEAQKAELLYRMADCEFHLRHYADAAEHYEKLVKNYGGYIAYDRAIRRLRTLAGYYNEGKVSHFGFSDPYRAMELYELICQKAPSEPLVVNDNLNLILLRIQEEEYDKAIAQCQHMLKTYPETRESAYAEFHLAKCYYDQAIGKDQDCDFATQAEVLFSEFIKNHPDFHPLIDDARSFRRKMQDRLDRHAYNIARFYWDSKYPASRKPYASRTYLYAIIANYENQLRAETAAGLPPRPEGEPEPGVIRDCRSLLATIEAAGFTAENEGKASDKILRPGDTGGVEAIRRELARPPIEEVDPDKLPPLPPVTPEEYGDDPKKTWLLPFEKPLGQPRGQAPGNSKDNPKKSE